MSKLYRRDPYWPVMDRAAHFVDCAPGGGVDSKK